MISFFIGKYTVNHAHLAVVNCPVLFSYITYIKIHESSSASFGISVPRIHKYREGKLRVETEMLRLRETLEASRQRYCAQLLGLSKAHGCFEKNRASAQK